MTLLAALIIVLASLGGVALTVLTLPGIWLTLATAAACQLWLADVLSWRLILAMFILAVLAEVVDISASAVGASRAGGTRRGAVGSLIGAIVGAVAGTPLIPVPVLGTVLGGAIGAGIGAVIFERLGGRKTWTQSARIGTGAAIGRLTASVLKIAFAVVIGTILTGAALWSAARTL